MAESVVSFAVETIGKLLIDEANFLSDVEGKVRDLQNELKLIQCLLRDADKKQEQDQIVREWVAQLRDIAYDAEDVIEQYILRVMLKKRRNIIKMHASSMAKCVCVRAHVVGIKIDGLKSSISNLRISMQHYGIQSMNEHAKAWMPERTYAFEEEDFIGREDSIKVLVKELKDEKQQRVVSLWGMGGLGKTTLAKKVFNHDEVKNHFNGFAWACISQQYCKRDILEGILAKLSPDKKEGVTKMREDELLENLYNTQKDKRCIVVLDDIWTKQAWQDLRPAFPVNNMRSKLLITTRNKEVVEYIDPHCFLYELQFLSNPESWVLLKKRAFPKTNVGQGIVATQAVEGIARQSEMEGHTPEITEDMQKLGDELLEKCGGLPLAIIVVGGLLAHNKWETICENMYFSDKSDLSKVLALSYDDLPWYLKPCFLYLGSFPEDAEIHAKSVLRMWIAEGFVPPNAYDKKGGIAMENVVEQYLMELVKRGLVQARLSLNGNIKTCHLHDLMRELCDSKARHQRFLSFHNIQQDDEMEGSSSSMPIEVQLTCKTRRLSLNKNMTGEGNVTPGVEQISTMPHIRTLMFFHCRGFELMWKQFRPIFINCKFLRVLKLENLFEMRGKLPKSVGDLVHLRFLSLARSEFKGLPQSMGNLVCMEFLDLSINIHTKVSMPNVLSKMRRLRYLCLPHNFAIKGKFHSNQKKLQLGTLKNLRTLRNFSLMKCDVTDVGKLPNLQKLTVVGWNGVMKQEIFSQLAKFKLKNLRSLSFYFGGFGGLWTEVDISKMSEYSHSCKLLIGGKIDKLPIHQSLPQQLRKLVLLYSQLEEDPMPILEKLPHLVVLKLVLAFMGNEMDCSTGGFPQLKHLVIHAFPNLEVWRADEGAMPLLSQLGIGNCDKLREVPSHVSPYEVTDHLYKELEKLYGFDV